jgi:hypothetical protein
MLVLPETFSLFKRTLVMFFDGKEKGEIIDFT